MVQLEAPPQTQEEWNALMGRMNTEVENMKEQMRNAEKSFLALQTQLEKSQKTVVELETKLESTLADRKFERRNILESKAVQGLDTLTESKGYRMWNKKVKNVLELLRRPARKILMWLDTVTEQAVNDEHDATCEPAAPKMEAIYGIWKDYIGLHKDNKVTKEEMEEFNKDLWALMVDKAEGEAWNKVGSVGEGEGMWAYIRVHQWFSKTTQQGKVANRVKLMQPEPPKHEWEVAGAIEKWEERYRQMVEENGEETNQK